MYPARRLLLQGPAVKDADATKYIARVEAADGQMLEPEVRRAIDEFVRGCKSDNTWNSIKASCIMAGARTLTGALTPLVGPAPTNFNFVGSDYDRKNGLFGNGATKYLSSNRINNEDATNDGHLAVNVVGVPSIGAAYIGIGAGFVGDQYYSLFNAGARGRNSSNAASYNVTPGFHAISRNSPQSFNWIAGAQSGTASVSSVEPTNNWVHYIFARDAGSVNQISNSVINFYSIGSYLEIARYQQRVTNLINSFRSVIS